GSSPNLFGRNFNATDCPSFKSSARYTSPIPALPRSPKIRYRSARIAPGVNPPTGTESEEISRLTPGHAGAASPRVGIWESETMAWPQTEQKWLSAAISAAQEGQ